MTDPAAMLVASEAQIRRLAQDWLRRARDGQVLAVTARPQWNGPDLIEVGGQQVRVVACPSPLAMRAALVDRSPDERLVVLTDVGEDELGLGLLAHVTKLRPVSIEPWELVRTQFGGADLDPALVRQGRWLAEALIEHAPPQGWPALTTRVITRDQALRGLTSALLGMPAGEIDSAGVLQWTTLSVEVVRFAALPAGLRDGVTSWLGETAGPAARWAMACVGSGHGTDAIALGLLAGLLWTPDLAASTGVGEARGRAESFIGGAPALADAAAWGEAARAWVERAADDPMTKPLADRVLARTEELARQLKAEFVLVRSDVLPAALQTRLHDFAARLQSAVDSRRAADVAAVESARVALRRHRLAPTDPRVGTAEMAVRLLRYLTQPASAPAQTLAEAVARYVREDGWVDRAVLPIWAGDADGQVAAVYTKLHAAIDERRLERDRHFATLLAGATSSETLPGSMLHVEDVLSRVVKPILDNGRRVLLLVVDGMSVAASTELVSSITDAGWIELTPAGGSRVGVLAAMPTVTTVSRTSLFCGRITTGGQAEEKAGLAAATVPEARLLHKAELRAGAGASLDPSVVDALTDPQVRLVGAVVNTIDDALERSDPGGTEWNIQTTVRAVRDLLTHARDRVVVLLSDHGHIVEHGSELRSLPGGSARWRTATTPAGDGELAFSGSRVALGGGTVVLPWRETLRYAAIKAGYHGGANPAEAVIPLTILTTGDETAVPGWAGAPVASPAWWRGPTIAAPVALVPAAADTLFDIVPAPTAVPSLEAPPLVAALLESPLYRSRHKMLGRAAPDNDRVAAMLGALLTAPGRVTVESIAVAAQIPAHRAAQTIGALRRLLQVDGYAVIDVDGEFVTLDQRLLREQFSLGTP